MLEGFKGVADFVSKLRGRPYSEGAARKASYRPVDRNPLPVTYECCHAFFDEEAVKAWNTREHGRRSRNSRYSPAD